MKHTSRTVWRDSEISLRSDNHLNLTTQIQTEKGDKKKERTRESRNCVSEQEQMKTSIIFFTLMRKLQMWGRSRLTTHTKTQKEEIEGRERIESMDKNKWGHLCNYPQTELEGIGIKADK